MRLINTLLTSLIITLAMGCRDSRFLDAIPDQALIIPKTLDDFQAILDNDVIMNGGGISQQGVLPSIGGIAAEEFALLESYYQQLPDFFKQVYTWQTEMPTFGEDLYDWTYPYRAIYYANTVLDGLAIYQPTAADQDHWNRLKGSALFFRAFMYYHLAEVFAPPYRETSATTDLGLPLRLKSDLGEPLERASNRTTYERILTDLAEATVLLPDLPDVRTRPSKAAAYALNARIRLSMQRYEEALTMADQALAMHDDLMDYRAMNTSLTYPNPRFNPEVIFHATLIAANTAARRSVLGSWRPTATLSELYAEEDIRSKLFYQTASPFNFKGSYNGNTYLFGGLATDELWLIKAECLARKGQTTESMLALNHLRILRFPTESFTRSVANSATDALTQILLERRRQLAYRGLRWSDLRRLNQEDDRQETLVRVINGITYTLPPNDPRYVYPIPDNVIALNPFIIQNNRK